MHASDTNVPAALADCYGHSQRAQPWLAAESLALPPHAFQHDGEVYSLRTTCYLLKHRMVWLWAEKSANDYAYRLK
jgi:hypothetical protein